MITAKVVADSIGFENRVRLTTMELTYPRFIHAELMTHRDFSRNAASSRAIPVEKMIAQVEMNPALPVRWGLNGKGMQDHGEMSEQGRDTAEALWREAAKEAAHRAREFLALDEVPHKQIINRLLEPFMTMRTLVSATEWNNFFKLRCHPDADPTFQRLAFAMKDAYDTSSPNLRGDGEWHMPYFLASDVENVIKYMLDDPAMPETFNELDIEKQITHLACRVSAARCARVSYVGFDGKLTSIAQDLELADKLFGSIPMHASPAEHVALPDTRETTEGGNYTLPWWKNKHEHGNFVGWRQYRKMLVGENNPTNRR